MSVTFWRQNYIAAEKRMLTLYPKVRLDLILAVALYDTNNGRPLPETITGLVDWMTEVWSWVELADGHRRKR